MPDSLHIVEGAALTVLQKKDLLHRVARIEGQLRSAQKLIAQADQPADCDAVAQQMAAARKGLERALAELLTATILTQSANADELQAAQASVGAMLDKLA